MSEITNNTNFEKELEEVRQFMKEENANLEKSAKEDAKKVEHPESVYPKDGLHDGTKAKTEGPLTDTGQSAAQGFIPDSLDPLSSASLGEAIDDQGDHFNKNATEFGDHFKKAHASEQKEIQKVGAINGKTTKIYDKDTNQWITVRDEKSGKAIDDRERGSDFIWIWTLIP